MGAANYEKIMQSLEIPGLNSRKLFTRNNFGMKQLNPDLELIIAS